MDYSNKTKSLVEQSAKQNKPILCADASEYWQMMQYAESVGLTIPNPISAPDLVNPEKKVSFTQLKECLVYNQLDCTSILHNILNELNVSATCVSGQVIFLDDVE